EQVALGGVARPGPAAGPVEALRPGEGRAPAGGIDDADLALRPGRIVAGEPVDGLLGAPPRRQELEAARPVRDVRGGLGGDGADLCLRPRHDRADGEKLRCDDDAPLACAEIARHEGEGHESVSPGWSSSTTTSVMPRLASSSRSPWGVPTSSGNVP